MVLKLEAADRVNEDDSTLTNEEISQRRRKKKEKKKKKKNNKTLRSTATTLIQAREPLLKEINKVVESKVKQILTANRCNKQNYPYRKSSYIKYGDIEHIKLNRYILEQ